MKKRTFKNFILLNDVQILTGDITITEKLLINNSSLIVYGNLTIDGDIEIPYGNLMVYGILRIFPSNYFSVNGNISSETLEMHNYSANLDTTTATRKFKVGGTLPKRPLLLHVRV